MSFRNKLKILSVVGARPNFMKVAPIASRIEEHNRSTGVPLIEHVIVHTGQHYDDSMSDRFFRDLAIPRPHINLDVGSGTHAGQTARVMERFEPVLLEEQPDYLLVVGDVNSTAACTLVASKIHYNGAGRFSRPIVCHVEAGLRSFDRSMPEEINRIVTDALSDLLFVTEADAIENLEREGIPPEKIHFVGNVMIDTLLTYYDKARSLNVLDALGYRAVAGVKYGVVTLHRPSNVDSRESLGELVECFVSIAARLPLIFPLHPRTQKNLSAYGLSDRLAGNNVYLTKPLGYLEFLNLLMTASLVLTDSGGIQEETTFLRVPCLTLRENTERPVTVKLGTNYLVGSSTENIRRSAFDILEGKTKGTSVPLWDGQASERILRILIGSLDRCPAL